MPIKQEWMYAAHSNSAKTPAEINFKPKTVKWVKFTILKGSADKLKRPPSNPVSVWDLPEIQVFEVK